jgi:hypothetical protein
MLSYNFFLHNICKLCRLKPGFDVGKSFLHVHFIFFVINKFLDTNYRQRPTVPPPLRTSMGMELTCPTLWWRQGTMRRTKRTKNAQETLSTSLGPMGKFFLYVNFIFFVTNGFLDTNYKQQYHHHHERRLWE